MDLDNGKEENSGQDSFVGGPRSLKIIPISSISPFAWKRGSLSNSSANMQPTDHMSMGVEYVVAPSKISGALMTVHCVNYCVDRWLDRTYRYHNVTTSCVNPPTPTGSPYLLARPKSATLMVPRLFIRRLLVLRSRCSIHCE